MCQHIYHNFPVPRLMGQNLLVLHSDRQTDRQATSLWERVKHKVIILSDNHRLPLLVGPHTRLEVTGDSCQAVV